MKEVIVTGCGDCPFFHQDSDEGSICNHPSNGDVGTKDVDFGYISGYNKTPDMCPLRTTPVIVKPSERLKL